MGTLKPKKRVHPNTIANLKKWPKGVSGNPAGRAKAGFTFAELIREYGEKECPPALLKELGLKEGAPWKMVVVAMAYRHAAKGNSSIFRTLVEYIDGRIPNIEIHNTESQQNIIILPALEDAEEYDPIAALRESTNLLEPVNVIAAPIEDNGNGNTNGNGHVNGNGYHKTE